MGIFTGWWGKKDKGKKSTGDQPPSSTTLPDFVRGIQHAVNTGMLMYEKNAAAFLDRHLKDDGAPEIQKVKLGDTKYSLHVPTMTTTFPPDMMLQEMEVRMSVRIDKAHAKKAHPNSNVDETRSSFQVSLTGTGSGGSGGQRQSNVIDLTMKFKRGDPPEGVSRIIEEFVRMIKPISDDGESPPEEEKVESPKAPPPPTTDEGPYEDPQRRPPADEPSQRQDEG